jgi:hypothetical protein
MLLSDDVVKNFEKSYVGEDKWQKGDKGKHEFLRRTISTFVKKEFKVLESPLPQSRPAQTSLYARTEARGATHTRQKSKTFQLLDGDMAADRVDVSRQLEVMLMPHVSCLWPLASCHLRFPCNTRKRHTNTPVRHHPGISLRCLRNFRTCTPPCG